MEKTARGRVGKHLSLEWFLTVISTNNSRTTRMSLVTLSSEAATQKASLSYGMMPKRKKYLVRI